MKMNKNFLMLGILLTAPLCVHAQMSMSSQGLDQYAAHFLDPMSPDKETLTVPQSTTDYAVRDLNRTFNTTAGVEMMSHPKEMKDMKQMAPVQEDSWFSDPVFYTDYQYSKIQDSLPAGIGNDGDKHSGTVGFDAVTFWKTIVGFNFTYSNTDLTSIASGGGFPTSYFTNSSDSYFFSSYAAKNFIDWINVGASFTYGRTDAEFRSNTPASSFGGFPFPGTNFIQDSRVDSYGLSPFIGCAHTFGQWSFSSTPTYIWNYNHYHFDQGRAGAFALPQLPGTRTINSSFLWLNNAQYAVNEQWKVEAIVNWTRNVSTATLTAPGSTPVDKGWMTFGTRVDYQFNKAGEAHVEFDHDAFSGNTDDWRIKGGITYAF